MGKLTNFQVLLDRTPAVYYAGQMMTGSVIVVLSESMTMRRIHLTLLGRAKVRWSEGGSKNRRNYKSEEVYFNDRLILVGSGNDEGNGEITLEAGSYSYPFSVAIPADSPSSFEGTHGYVRYTAQATIDKPWKFDHESRIAFTVICLLDLNLEPLGAKKPYTQEESQDVSCCCCVSGSVEAKFTINRQCFVPGENAVIHAVIDNNSNRTVSKMWVSLKQQVQYEGARDSFFGTGNLHTKLQSNCMATVENTVPVPAGETRIWSDVYLPIPPVAPSKLQGCSIINIFYCIKLYTSNGLKLSMNVTIGTIPLHEAVTGASAITTRPQMQASSADDVLLAEMATPPPSYEACVGGPVSISEDGDSRFIRCDTVWAPHYPMYRQLSYPSGQPNV